jgi:hypothetical protein
MKVGHLQQNRSTSRFGTVSRNRFENRQRLRITALLPMMAGNQLTQVRIAIACGKPIELGEKRDG